MKIFAHSISKLRTADFDIKIDIFFLFLFQFGDGYREIKAIEIIAWWNKFYSA